jgi:hypothetical protein
MNLARFVTWAVVLMNLSFLVFLALSGPDGAMTRTGWISLGVGSATAVLVIALSAVQLSRAFKGNP